MIEKVIISLLFLGVWSGVRTADRLQEGLKKQDSIAKKEGLSDYCSFEFKSSLELFEEALEEDEERFGIQLATTREKEEEREVFSLGQCESVTKNVEVVPFSYSKRRGIPLQYCQICRVWFYYFDGEGRHKKRNPAICEGYELGKDEDGAVFGKRSRGKREYCDTCKIEFAYRDKKGLHKGRKAFCDGRPLKCFAKDNSQ